jgi:hypothetical protein
LPVEVARIDTFLLLAALAWVVGFGAASAYRAVQRRRNPLAWAVLGAILGPIALVILQVAPPGKCWSCSAPTIGWMTVCLWCGEDVREHEDEPEPEAPLPPVVHAPLTVIEGSAPPRTVDPMTDPVQAMQARLGGTAPSAGANTSAVHGTTHASRSNDAHDVVLASAVYMTGSRGLQAGSRYGIALIGGNLGILGPVDVDPTAIALVRPLGDIDATGIQGQLVITAAQGSRDRFALVFMSVAGGTPEGVADVIAAAAATKATAAR